MIALTNKEKKYILQQNKKICDFYKKNYDSLLNILGYELLIKSDINFAIQIYDNIKDKIEDKHHLLFSIRILETLYNAENKDRFIKCCKNNKIVEEFNELVYQTSVVAKEINQTLT